MKENNQSPFLEFSDEKLLSFLVEKGSKSKYQMIKYTKEFCVANLKNAIRLFDYIISKEYQSNYLLIIANLFFELYKADRTFYKRKAELFRLDISLGFFVLGRLNFDNKEDIIDCHNYIKNVQSNKEEDLFEVPYLYKSLIENKLTPEDIRKENFLLLRKLFLSGSDSLRNEIFEMCALIKGYDIEKFDLLTNVFLSKSENYFKKISHYFLEFEDPTLFFLLYGNLYLIAQKNGAKFSSNIFKEAFSHFWRKNKEKTVTEVLKLLTHNNQYLRLGAVELIATLNTQKLSSLNLLTLENESSQLRALEVLVFSSYYDIEAILKVILTLEKSPYPTVTKYLQDKLSELIFNSYHDFLFEKVETIVKNKDFITPLKRTLENYHIMCDLKGKINDLNPVENEKEFMNLYYRLEGETNRKMFNDANKGSFLNVVKETIIVRGNSWKIGDNEVSQLGKIEKSIPIDLDMYKNPDLYDFQKNNFKSKY